jgi:hypothetical protein
MSVASDSWRRIRRLRASPPMVAGRDHEGRNFNEERKRVLQAALTQAEELWEAAETKASAGYRPARANADETARHRTRSTTEHAPLVAAIRQPSRGSRREGTPASTGSKTRPGRGYGARGIGPLPQGWTRRRRARAWRAATPRSLLVMSGGEVDGAVVL